MKKSKVAFITIIIVLGNIFIDRITKVMASIFLKGEDIKSFLADIIRISYVENTGAFLSLGAEWPEVVKYIVLLILPTFFCFYGIYYCIKKLTDIKMIVFISTIIGGGLGNIIDRAFFDFRVIDFLNFGIGNLRTGVLNVADLSVTFGAILLVIYETTNNKNTKSSKLEVA